MDTEDFEVAWAEGRVLSTDEAIAAARRACVTAARPTTRSSQPRSRPRP